MDYKGIEYLLRTIPMIVDKIPDFRIIIAGDGKFKNMYMIRNQKMRNFITALSRILKYQYSSEGQRS